MRVIRILLIHEMNENFSLSCMTFELCKEFLIELLPKRLYNLL